MPFIVSDFRFLGVILMSAIASKPPAGYSKQKEEKKGKGGQKMGVRILAAIIECVQNEAEVRVPQEAHTSARGRGNPTGVSRVERG
jgi:hypothetical protein